MINPELKEAAKYWALISVALAFCVFVGKVFAQTGSIYIPIFFIGLTVAGVTFYSPKAALGLIVFSMLLSPKVPGMQIGTGHYQSTVVIRFDDLLLGIVFFAWVARTAILKPASFLLSTPIHLPIFLYTSACVVSTMLAVMSGRIAPLRSFFFVLKYLEYFLLFFMTVNVVEDREDIRRYLLYGWITAVVVTLYGYYQIPSGERITAPFEAPLGASHEEKMMASEPNTLGGYYVIIFSMLLGFFTQLEARASLAALASFVFMLLPFFYTLSRSSYIGLSASILSHLMLTRKRRLALLFGVGFSGMLFVFVPKLKNAVFGRIAYTFTGEESSGQRNEVYAVGQSNLKLEGSAAARYFSWKRIVFTQFPHHPIFGWGITGVGMSDTQFPLVIGETGIVGACLFFWMLYRIWKCAGFVWRYGGEPSDRALALGLMTALTGLLFHGLGANTFIIVRIMEPFWFTVALVTRLYMDQRLAQAKG